MIDFIDAHNKAVDKNELSYWDSQPDRFNAYVGSYPRGLWPDMSICGSFDSVTTWLGTELGKIMQASVYRNNFGAIIACIRVYATNGAEYYGRFGYGTTDLIHLRKIKP